MAESASRARMTRDETLEMQPDTVIPELEITAEPAPLTLHRSHRRPFGANPVPLLGGLGGIALVTAIALLADGVIVGGLVVLMLAVPLLGLFAGGVLWEPHAPAAGRSLRFLNRVRSLAGLVATGARAEGRAGIGLARVRTRQHQLRRELKATMAPLGEAVHCGDQPRADALRHRATDLERQLAELDDEASSLIAAAREELAIERATIEPTRSFTSGALAGPHDRGSLNGSRTRDPG